MNINVPTGRQSSRLPWPMDRLFREQAIALGNTIEPATLHTYNLALTSYLTFIRAHNLPTPHRRHPKVTTTQLPNRYSELTVDDTSETPADVFTLPKVTCTKTIQNPNGKGNFRKIPRLVPRKLGLTLSTFGWKLKAQKLSGSRESAL